jgi:hypothetical protein
MNNIATIQNEPRQIERLAAQRRLYSIAKRIFAFQLVLGGPVAIAWAVVVLLVPDFKGVAAAWGILVSLSDLAWLTPWQKRLRERAARVQESFDCDVLELPWNDIKAGKTPEPELVKEQADKYAIIQSKYPPLSNWYAPIVSELPLEVGRVICQRANCWWDSTQRRRYAASVIGVISVVTVLMVAVAFARGLTVDKFILAVVAPLSPALILAYRQYTEQMEAATRLDKLKEHAERLWADSCNRTARATLTNRSRALQDEIFENRKRSPLVFDWIFRKLRKDYDAQMNHGAQELAEQAKKRLGMAAG